MNVHAQTMAILDREMCPICKTNEWVEWKWASPKILRARCRCDAVITIDTFPNISE